MLVDERWPRQFLLCEVVLDGFGLEDYLLCSLPVSHYEAVAIILGTRALEQGILVRVDERVM
jgi:hypothetical protein